MIWASMMRTSTVPQRGCRRTSHQRNVGSGKAPQRKQQVDALDVVVVVGKGAWEPDARERPEHRRSRRGEPGLSSLPEGGVRRQRQQQRQMRAQAVHRAHRVLGVGDRDVDVQGERRLAARELAQRRVEQLIALATGDARLLPDGRGVHAGGGRAQPSARELVAQLAA